jgi:hypothetical protein
MAKKLVAQWCRLNRPSPLYMGLRCVSRYYSEGLPWEKTPYRAARVDLSKIPAHRWTQELRDKFPQLLKGERSNN